MSHEGETVHLGFALEIDDGWPPVAVESLPLRVTREGHVVEAPPLFVKDLSVGDVIELTRDATNGLVFEWRHVAKSESTTVWLLRMKPCDAIEPVLAGMRALGCNTADAAELGVYAIAVPASVAIEAVDGILAELDPEAVAVAFPSMRHAEA